MPNVLLESMAMGLACIATDVPSGGCQELIQNRENGAVSVLGTVSGIVGSAIIGIAAYFLGIMPNPFLAILVSIISGTIGCFGDSILGALFENNGWLTNEHVNLLATIFGALVGILLI